MLKGLFKRKRDHEEKQPLREQRENVDFTAKSDMGQVHDGPSDTLPPALNDDLAGKTGWLSRLQSRFVENANQPHGSNREFASRWQED